MNTSNEVNYLNLFIVLGAHKCGTTSLHHHLGQHPEIAMPQLKGQDILNKPGMTLEDYRNQYDAITNQKIAGDVSSAYLYSERACNNIKQYFPQAKLIAILRNPFDRAFSNFYDIAETHPLRRRFAFEDICKKPDNFRDEGVVYLGLYYSFLKMYLERFDRSQIHIFYLKILSKINHFSFLPCLMCWRLIPHFFLIHQ